MKLIAQIIIGTGAVLIWASATIAVWQEGGVLLGVGFIGAAIFLVGILVWPLHPPQEER